MTNAYIVYIVYIFSTVYIALCYSIKVQVEITKDGVLFYFYQRCNIIIVFTKPKFWNFHRNAQQNNKKTNFVQLIT